MPGMSTANVSRCLSQPCCMVSPTPRAAHSVATFPSGARHRRPHREAAIHRRSVVVVSAQTSPSASSSSSPSPSLSQPQQQPTFSLACPICQTTEFKIQQINGHPVPVPSTPTTSTSATSTSTTSSSHLACPRCQRRFATSPTSIDLTLTSGIEQKVYQQRNWGGVEIFRNPLVSLAYERGWRQGFAWAGFPGVDKETEMALEYLKPAYNDVIVDMSCGSGLFARRFLSSGRFAGVIAADFSESMIREARQYFDQEATRPRSGLDPSQYLLIRADVARQPFVTGSVAALHAGAAIHCWPNPQAALAEVSRVLRPGGVFVASTFLTMTAPLGQALGNDALVRPLKGLEPSPRAYKWWEEDELRDLCTAVGLQAFTCRRSNRFIMFSATKPN